MLCWEWLCGDDRVFTVNDAVQCWIATRTGVLLQALSQCRGDFEQFPG